MPKADEHVVVVGGTSGMGLPLAAAAYALGCKTTITGRGAERASEIAKSIGPGRRAETANDQQLQRIPAARTIAKLMTTERDHLTKSETVTVAAIEKGVPTLAEARALVDRFQAMIRQKTESELEAWIIESIFVAWQRSF